MNRPSNLAKRWVPLSSCVRWASRLVLGALSVANLGCLSFYAGAPPGEPKLGTFTRLGDDAIRFVDTARQDTPPPSGQKTVILVHGFGATIEEWASVIPALKASGFRVLALDLLGHGWSSRPDGDYSIDAQAARVLALADQRGIDRFAIVGHSWGSAVSMAVAMAAPKRVTRIGLYNGMYFEDQQPVLFSWARVPGLGELIYGVFYPDRVDEKMAFAFYEPDRWIDEKTVDAVGGLNDRPGTLAAALAGVRAMKFAELEKNYPTVSQPVLILWGNEDKVTPIFYGHRLLTRLSNARMVSYPHCGHLPMIEVSGASTHELLRFLHEGRS